MTARLLVRDCLKAGFCRRGIREKCELLDIDWESFRREGVDLDVAAAVDDFHVRRAVTAARTRIAEDARGR